ncbi:hypothetical protein KAR91_62475 [Candidatus Pacearchaeota archaeon]|nr:hypothetical protein [Candidatus Pacearchaeota archaeon]
MEKAKAEREGAMIIAHGSLDVQVCVPKEWTDGQVISFAKYRYPPGTKKGWFIRREGDEALNGNPERAVCLARPDFVHIVLDA